LASALIETPLQAFHSPRKLGKFVGSSASALDLTERGYKDIIEIEMASVGVCVSER
jgi:hypothetical protein